MSAIAEANSAVSWFARADRTLNSRPEALQVAVEVSGTRATEAAARELFTEATHTTLVFADGAVVRLSAAVAVGQLLFVRHERTQREIVTRVLKQRRISPSSAYVEVEFTDAAPDFWTEDLQLAAAVSEEAPARGKSTQGKATQATPTPVTAKNDAAASDVQVHAVEDSDAAAQEAASTELSLPDSATDSYELLEDSGALAGAQPTSGAGAESKGGPAATAAALIEPDKPEVARLRAGSDTMRAQMSAVLESTNAMANRRASDVPKEVALETPATEIGKVSEDLAQMFASLVAPSAKHEAPADASAPVTEKREAAKNETFAAPILPNSGVTPEEFAKELEKLNRARKQGISPEELPDEHLAAGENAHQSELAQQANDAESEARDESPVTEINSRKRGAAAALSGAAGGGLGHMARIGLIAALLTIALLGGVAYWKGWIGGGGNAAGNVNAAGAPRAGNGVLPPAAGKATADDAGTNGATAEERAKAARENDAAVLNAGKDAPAAGDNASAQKSTRTNGGVQQAKYRTADAAAAASAEESGNGYEPPKLVKAVNAVPPAEAVQNFVTGDVKFNAIIDEAGKVESAEVLSGPEQLRAAALEALKKYQFKPAVRNGQAVAGHVVVAVKFWYEP